MVGDVERIEQDGESASAEKEREDREDLG